MALPANIALPFQCKALLALTEAEADDDNDDDDDEIQVKLVYLLWANGSADIANAAGSRRSLSSTLCPLPSALLLPCRLCLLLFGNNEANNKGNKRRFWLMSKRGAWHEGGVACRRGCACYLLQLPTHSCCSFRCLKWGRGRGRGVFVIRLNR